MTRRLGVGGMGEVWMGRREALGGAARDVAIKLLSAERARNDEARKMFIDEARLSMLLRNSNIVQVYDVAETTDGTCYMVMEFVEGLNVAELSEKLSKTRQVMPDSITAYIIGEVLKGLTHAHELRCGGQFKTIVHRDMSPHNVMLSVFGEVKIMDFGIARVASEDTSGIHVKGKLRYMPPEQLRGETREPTLDLFAVGAMLHELLDGVKFRSNVIDESRLFGMILDGEVPPLQRPAGTVPKELEELRRLLLAVKPQDRIQSARRAFRKLSAWSGYHDTRFELEELVRRHIRHDQRRLTAMPGSMLGPSKRAAGGLAGAPAPAGLPLGKQPAASKHAPAPTQSSASRPAPASKSATPRKQAAKPSTGPTTKPSIRPSTRPLTGASPAAVPRPSTRPLTGASPAAVPKPSTRPLTGGVRVAPPPLQPTPPTPAPKGIANTEVVAITDPAPREPIAAEPIAAEPIVVDVDPDEAVDEAVDEPDESVVEQTTILLADGSETDLSRVRVSDTDTAVARQTAIVGKRSDKSRLISTALLVVGVMLMLFGAKAVYALWLGDEDEDDNEVVQASQSEAPEHVQADEPETSEPVPAGAAAPAAPSEEEEELVENRLDVGPTAAPDPAEEAEVEAASAAGEELGETGTTTGEKELFEDELILDGSDDDVLAESEREPLPDQVASKARLTIKLGRGANWAEAKVAGSTRTFNVFEGKVSASWTLGQKKYRVDCRPGATAFKKAGVVDLREGDATYLLEKDCSLTSSQ